MPEWKRERLLCRQCDYDVAQSVADSQPVCPECGAPIDAANLCRREEFAPAWIRWSIIGSICVAMLWPVVSMCFIEFQGVNIFTLGLVILPVLSITPSIALERWLVSGGPDPGATRRGVTLGFAMFVGGVAAGALLFGVLTVMFELPEAW